MIRNQLPYVSAYVSAKSGKIWPFEKKKNKAQNELKNIIKSKKKFEFYFEGTG